MADPSIPALCRNCGRRLDSPADMSDDGRRCGHCGSTRIVRHPELHDLSLAHLDCDAFYAAVEKRDNPDLHDVPLIIGGGSSRGVVSTACYIARMSGVHSAMPMFKARRLCPDAVVMPPDMTKYAAVSKQIRALMLETTPLVEPLSLDEAFLDLSGTAALHHRSPAETLVHLIRRIEEEVGVTASIGLSYCKFLAKLCSDLEKPRGFSIVGRAEAVSFLGPRPVSDIWGVGKAMNKALAKDGITTIGQLLGYEERDLMARYGSMGRRLWRFARGEDSRGVNPDAPSKSISAETTFGTDIRNATELGSRLWSLSEKVSRRLKKADLAGKTVVLKLKTAGFATRTRNQALADPTQLAEVIYRAARPLLDKEADGTPFRLIGVGVTGLSDGAEADPADIFNPRGGRMADVERAMDHVRSKFGDKAILKGRGLKPTPR